MYIKLGSTKLNYLNQASNDFIILSQVVDSSLSYERPILVRTVKELDLWFGKEFNGRDYLVELLNYGVTLYLYKPISSEKIINPENYIDLSKYEHVDGYTENPSTEVIYTINGDDYVYLEESGYILVDNLPQNQETNNTKSLNNRDTLSIGINLGNTDTKYYYISPKFDESGLLLDTSINIGLGNVNYDKLKKGYQGISNIIKLDYLNDFCEFKPGEYGYLVLEDTAIYLSGTPIKVFPEDSETSGKFKTNIVIRGSIEDRINQFKEGMKIRGYDISNDNHLYIQGSSKIIELSEFYKNFKVKVKGLDISFGDYQKTSSLVYNVLKKNEIISFYSKTIGTSDLVDGNINITIEEVKQGYYRITVSRFEYSEVFEGTLDSNLVVPELKELITSTSNLVYCDINADRGYYKCIKDNDKLIWVPYNESLKNDDIKKLYVIYNTDDTSNSKEGDIALYRLPLPTGSWELTGAIVENSSPDSYKESLNTLINSTDTVPIDFILIPDIDKFGIDIDDKTGSYKIYETILNLSKEIDCQVLIHNKPIEEVKDNGDSFVISGPPMYNYLNDSDNRLLYFYDSIKVYGESRPGYYIYLRSILVNDIYSPKSTEIQYNSPIKDPYSNFLTENKKDSCIEDWLKKYKTNYLVTNNHYYYYKEYQNGISYDKTGWMRFCISKINRELIKSKWIILENRNIGKMEQVINNILQYIKNSFSMIRDIKLSNLLVDFYKSTIDLTIDTSVSDLYNNHLTIDITINYSKNLN